MLTRLRNTDPAVLAFALLIGVAAYVASRYVGDEQAKVMIGYAVAAVTLFLNAQKASAATGEHDGGDALGPDRGSRVTDTPSSAGDVLSLKRDLLASWAAKGEDVDDALELKAELAAIAIGERAARHFPVKAPAEDKGG